MILNGHNSATELYERVMCRVMMALGGQSMRIPFKGGKLHALEIAGEGKLPPVALLHGFSASGASQYWGMVRRLRSQVRRVLLPDLPGHGLSSVPGDLDAEILQHGLCRSLEHMIDEPVVLFASSLSGGLAVRYAVEHPHQVRGLMLCSPGGAPISEDERGELMRLFRMRRHDDALAFVDRLFPRRHPLRHLYALGVRQQFNRPHLVKMLDRVHEMRFLEPDELGELTVPVHLLWGEGDRILPHSHFEFYRDNLPDGAVIERPTGFGHAPFLHEAGALTACLLRFCHRLRDSA